MDSMKVSGYQDVDYVLTTREMVRLLRAEHIDPRGLQEMPLIHQLVMVLVQVPSLVLLAVLWKRLCELPTR